MKKQVKKMLVLFISFLLSIQLVSAQKADTSLIHPSKTMYDLYMQRHKTFNTIGWVLLGPGTAMFIIGLAEASSNYDIFSPNYDKNRGVALFFVGGTMMLASIPCLIIAGSNKRKAYLQLKSGNIPGASNFNYTAVALKIKF